MPNTNNEETKLSIEEQIAAIIEAMPAALQNACRNALKTNVLSIYGIELNDEGFQAYIMPFIKLHTSLNTLTLNHQHIGNRSAKELAAYLKGNNTLASLNLSDTDIGDEGAQHLADALSKNNTLSVLNFSENEITNSTKELLLDTVTRKWLLHKRLIDIDLITKREVDIIRNNLPQTRSHTVICFAKNHRGGRMFAGVPIFHDTRWHQDTTPTALQLRAKQLLAKDQAKRLNFLCSLHSIRSNDYNQLKNFALQIFIMADCTLGLNLAAKMPAPPMILSNPFTAQRPTLKRIPPSAPSTTGQEVLTLISEMETAMQGANFIKETVENLTIAITAMSTDQQLTPQDIRNINIRLDIIMETYRHSSDAAASNIERIERCQAAFSVESTVSNSFKKING